MPKKEISIQNVVCTSNLNQKVNVSLFNNFPWGFYDSVIYGGRCGYIKTPEMKGKVTVFPSGKLISVGAKSILEAKNQLNHAKFYLLQENMISNTKLRCNIQNIVALMNINRKITLSNLTKKITKSVYNPQKFPAIIYKTENGSCLIFSSGKIIISGVRSTNELDQLTYFLINKIKSFQ